MKNNVNNLVSGITLNKDGTVYVLSKKVFCEGDLSFSRHPGVFLKTTKKGEKESVSCPYCKQVFIYKSQDNAK